ncbi:MAG: hypothetical protein WC389_21825 [Lutibacter sp.]
MKLFNDTTLKDLMLIPTVDKTNLAKVRDTYIVETNGSDAIVTTENAKIMYYNVPLTDTNNQYCKWDGMIFKIFVKSSQEYTLTNGLDKRQLAIADRLNEILSRQYVADWKWHPVDKGSLFCGTSGYKLYFVRYAYKRIY